jgi:hypothetical protein
MASSSNKHSYLPAWIAVLVATILLSGCVGFSRSTLVYEEVKTDLRTKSDVLGKFGEPLRKTKQDELEVWHYLLPRATATRGIQATQTQAILGFIPLWWTTKVDENAQFIFRADALVQLLELDEKQSGFLCGVIPAHGIQTGCGSFDEKKEERKAR